MLRVRREVRRRPERAVPAAGHPRRVGQAVPDDGARVRGGARSRSSPIRRGGAGLQAAQAGATGRSPTRRRWPTRSWNTRTSTDPSVYVEFPVDDRSDPASTARTLPVLLVWTTTPWTLPANLAIAVHPDVRIRVRRLHPRRQRARSASSPTTWSSASSRTGPASTSLRRRRRPRTGKELVGMEYRHPFVERASGRVVARRLRDDHRRHRAWSTPRPATARRTTTPASHNGLRDLQPRPAPTAASTTPCPSGSAARRSGKRNPLIIEKLQRARTCCSPRRRSRHSYPHDWRSKTPTIFRATEQWFVAMDKPFTRRRRAGEAATLRQRGASTRVQQADRVRPRLGPAAASSACSNPAPTGASRRQRAWGLPIPVFYNEQGEPLLTPESVRAVAKRFAREGQRRVVHRLAGRAARAGLPLPGRASDTDKLRKEKDIFDVWFESGSSWHARAAVRART